MVDGDIEVSKDKRGMAAGCELHTTYHYFRGCVINTASLDDQGQPVAAHISSVGSTARIIRTVTSVIKKPVVDARLIPGQAQGEVLT